MTLAASFLGQGGGGRVLPYISIGKVLPQRVGFLRLFGLKMGIDFAHFGLIRVWVSRALQECMNLFIVSIPNDSCINIHCNNFL